MKRHIFSIVCAMLFACAPVVSHAAVIINEIAWMGTAVSASDEWIELYNNGTESVDLTGWKLKASDNDPSIVLSGSISAGAYYLLERTDDLSAPDVPADKIYSGNIGNTGEVFTLSESLNAVIDTVDGGTDWKTIGGNNTTKDTPQRQADNTWITGTPTPKAENSTVDKGTGTSSGGSSGSVLGATISKPKVTGGYKQVVFAYAGEDVVIPAGAHMTFEAFAVNDRNEPLGGVHYTWAFGDGAKESGDEVIHAYQEPGVYVAVLSISSNNQRSKDERIITVVPADVRISQIVSGGAGYIELSNDTEQLLDISKWKLFMEKRRAGSDRMFTFPENTFLAPHTNVKFSARVTNLRAEEEDTLILLYPNETRVADVEEDESE